MTKCKERESLLQAIELAIDGRWEESHNIVQLCKSENAAWIHAVLHKIEGDIDNARYWYKKADRAYNVMNGRDELPGIMRVIKATK